ncbi:hypothetical protein BCR42DRAFT_435294 [Absidia repens]|uniref:Uncharacterized protein n=1 Tax=Absidia repens TaxID=90262 RepID=A0A1X2IN16_9FUNG|nr:hypothetical protein BCR42DRAFT_435294 [Absidia repens]
MEARPTKIYRIPLVIHGNQVLPLFVSHFKALSESRRLLLTPLKSNTYECGLYLKTLSESSRLLLTPLKSNTYECGLYLKTLSESSLETTPTLFYLSSYNTLYPLDIENNRLFYTRKNTPLAFI